MRILSDGALTCFFSFPSGHPNKKGASGFDHQSYEFPTNSSLLPFQSQKTATTPNPSTIHCHGPHTCSWRFEDATGNWYVLFLKLFVRVFHWHRFSFAAGDSTSAPPVICRRNDDNPNFFLMMTLPFATSTSRSEGLQTHSSSRVYLLSRVPWLLLCTTLKHYSTERCCTINVTFRLIGLWSESLEMHKFFEVFFSTLNRLKRLLKWENSNSFISPVILRSYPDHCVITRS